MNMLPSDRYLCNLLGITEEEFLEFQAAARQHLKDNPIEGPVAGLETGTVLAIISLAVSVGATALSFLLRPSIPEQKAPGQIRTSTTADDPVLRVPVPFGLIFISTLVSPVADKTGPFPVAALAIVNSLTAELVAVRLINSFPFVFEIFVPIAGLVKVLFVKVCVPVVVTSPSPKARVIILGLVPSLADAKTN